MFFGRGDSRRMKHATDVDVKVDVKTLVATCQK